MSPHYSPLNSLLDCLSQTNSSSFYSLNTTTTPKIKKPVASKKTKMCSSKSKSSSQGSVDATPGVSKINGRPVLQPTCNRVPNLERRHNGGLKKVAPIPLSNVTTTRVTTLSPPISPKSKSPKPRAVKRGGHELATVDSGVCNDVLESPGSIAATRRVQVAVMQEQRKMKIAHYGRTKSCNNHHDEKTVVTLNSSTNSSKKRCSFITPNSDPVYVAYHDEEWGVPVHDDKRLFELLVLTGAQLGSDWTSVLKRRHIFCEAFSNFDAESVAKLSEKKIVSISNEYGMELSQVRGVVDNAKRIVEIKRVIGSFDKYLWGFVSNKAVTSNYKSCNKIPVKTSKSETISKDMVKRGFRLVGPTVVHSFMQAAGLSNDHLVTCHRHLHCIGLQQAHA